MNKKTVIFRIGEETKPVIVDSKDYQDSLLGDQISQAIKCVKTIVDEFPSSQSWENTPFSDVYHNNIVSYIGDRGTGKTSCMYSVANILRQRGEKYYCLDAIDPSFFDDHHNILQIVIGKMYGKFQKEYEVLLKYGKKEHDIMNLSQRFLETKKHLRYLDKEPEYIDDNEMEDLHQLASGVDLKVSVMSLVDEFLRFFDKDVLVISIDDIDQNFTKAYEMAEQLRKYLIIPNVIIQLAVKIDQLSDIVQNKMATQYHNLDKSRNPSVIKDMADRYIVKLLPLESRVYMPEMEVFFDDPLQIYNEGTIIEYGDVKTTVTQLIFIKCRYLFYNTRGTTSAIVPRNLRELRMLVSMLVRMPDYCTYADDGSVVCAEVNKEVFKNYFFNDWLNKLNDSLKGIAVDLINENEPTRFNKKVIRLLYDETGYPYNFNGEKLPNYLLPIVQDNNANYNVSIGDAFTYMDYLSKVDSRKDWHLLVFFIKSLYSIRLFEYYNILTENLKMIDDSEKDSKPYRRYDILENVSYLQKFVGGSYYYLSGDTLIAKSFDLNKDNQREIRLIDGQRLNELIRDVVFRYSDIKKQTQTQKTLFTQDLQMAEFFMLTASRHIVSKTGGKESANYRDSLEAYYDKNLSQVTNIEFNIMTPFFSLLDVEHTYRRFNPLIFSISKAWNDIKNGFISLYNLIIRECNDCNDYLPEQNLLSKATIRNAEIAEDLYLFLEKRRANLRPASGGEIGVLAEFCRNVFSYQIGTYDTWKKEDGKPTHNLIRFIPFKVLAEFLFECKDQSKFYNIYNKVLANKVTPYKFLDKSMSRDNLWMIIIEMYPNLNTIEHHEEFLYRFRSNKKYNRATIIQKLDALSKMWGLKLDGTRYTNE